MFKVLTILGVTAAIVLGTTLPRVFRSCPDGTPYFDSIIVPGCVDTDASCIFQDGQLMSSTFTFTAASAIDSMRLTVLVTFGGQDIVYPLPEDDGCLLLSQGNCPLSAGEIAALTVEAQAAAIAPNATLVFTARLLDQVNATIVCGQFDITIISP